MCGKCERPICTRCLVNSPAGTRCRECSALRSSHLYKFSPLLLLLEAVIATAAGVLGYFLQDQIGFFFFFIFFLAPMYGCAVAELILKIIGRKHGTMVELVGTAAFVVGGVAPSLVYAFLGHSAIILVQDWRAFLAIGLAASACFGRLKYF